MVERGTEIERNNYVREKHLRKVVIGFWRKKNAGDDKAKKQETIQNLLAESGQAMFGKFVEISIKIRFFSAISVFYLSFLTRVSVSAEQRILVQCLENIIIASELGRFLAPFLRNSRRHFFSHSEFLKVEPSQEDFWSSTDYCIVSMRLHLFQCLEYNLKVKNHKKRRWYSLLSSVTNQHYSSVVIFALKTGPETHL